MRQIVCCGFCQLQQPSPCCMPHAQQQNDINSKLRNFNNNYEKKKTKISKIKYASVHFALCNSVCCTLHQFAARGNCRPQRPLNMLIMPRTFVASPNHCLTEAHADRHAAVNNWSSSGRKGRTRGEWAARRGTMCAWLEIKRACKGQAQDVNTWTIIGCATNARVSAGDGRLEVSLVLSICLSKCN